MLKEKSQTKVRCKVKLDRVIRGDSYPELGGSLKDTVTQKGVTMTEKMWHRKRGSSPTESFCCCIVHHMIIFFRLCKYLCYELFP